jgi:hypothetical protein
MTMESFHVKYAEDIKSHSRGAPTRALMPRRMATVLRPRMEDEAMMKPFWVWIIDRGKQIQKHSVWAEDKNRAKRYYRNFFALGYKDTKLGCCEAPEMGFDSSRSV